jgi:hypothetical protein
MANDKGKQKPQKTQQQKNRDIYGKGYRRGYEEGKKSASKPSLWKRLFG